MSIHMNTAPPPATGGTGGADAPQGKLGGRLFKACMRPAQRALRSVSRMIERVKRWRSASPTLVAAATGPDPRVPKAASMVGPVNLGVKLESAPANLGRLVWPDGRPPVPARPERLEQWLRGDGAPPLTSNKSERPKPKPRTIMPGGQGARSRSDDVPPTPPPRFTKGSSPFPHTASPVDDAGYSTLTRPKPEVSPYATWSPSASESKATVPGSTSFSKPKMVPYATWSPSASESKATVPESTSFSKPKMVPYATWSPSAPKSQAMAPDSSPGPLPEAAGGG